jgi:hypothetical protein
MIVKFTTKGKLGLRPVRHSGIGVAAKELGVSRQHVWGVIVGKNSSRRVSEYLRQNLRRAG